MHQRAWATPQATLVDRAELPYYQPQIREHTEQHTMHVSRGAILNIREIIVASILAQSFVRPC